ncbi:RluA family pseudouridine synthase [Alienimonas californiensis]|uniref:Pseudouridine synthase n=1 Tax=Alienimonas californiensis TaxID=2527989 RepID=A0A517PD77_9PLAN|nr:RluA family pseudouridine synthase [Alienimonas californiensis]QDT17334.1 Ribosomal large subunit pseudouridine synthase D [Alienimonas californiensis]
MRVDTFLHKHFRNHSPARLSRTATTGGVTLDDGTPVGPRRRVTEGDTLLVRLADPPDWAEEAEDEPLDVLYEDPWLLAVRKPAGVICHPTGATTGGTLMNRIQAHLDRQAPRGLLSPGIVHRLDGATTGVLLTCKTADAHAGVCLQFENRETGKAYLALVEGDLRPDAGRCDRPIGKRRNSALMTCGPDALAPKPARTDWRVLLRLGDATLVRCALYTGRNHQIRVHLAALGHPVIGDAFYAADGGLKWPPGECPNPARRHALHAAELSFRHPILGTPLTVRCPPTDFTALLAERRRSAPVGSLPMT